jgi:uncharacterized protein
MKAYYLGSRGAANTLHGDGGLEPSPPCGMPADQYAYDPQDPTPSWPDHKTKWAPQALSLDQTWVQARPDVLVYTSAPLEAPLRLAGTPRAVLWVNSDAPDTDFYVTLSHVYPEGRALRIAWNAMRMRFRESLRVEEPMTPGQVYRLELDLSPICDTLAPGHRIRVDIRSANFPIYDRNPNTGHPIGEDAELRIAHQTVHHTAARPSHVLLPEQPVEPRSGEVKA